MKSIADCRTLELDTEEKEFVVDLYTELSYVIGVILLSPECFSLWAFAYDSNRYY